MANQTRKHVMRSSPEDMGVAEGAPDTAQTRAPAYRLAYDDAEFLCSDELRPIRLQLELLKPELVDQSSTIFGFFFDAGSVL